MGFGLRRACGFWDPESTRKPHALLGHAIIALNPEQQNS